LAESTLEQGFFAVVLAGGRSSRMGRPKAELKFGTSTLLDRVIEELRNLVSEIVVVVGPDGIDFDPTLKGVTLIRDEHYFQGPLPALARGLRVGHGEVAFTCSCDLPLLKASVASWLCAQLSDYDAVVPVVGQLPQPLHAIYRTRCAESIDAMVARGEKRLSDIVATIRARRVEEDELRKIDPDLRSFLNVNTPEDFQYALSLAAIRR
jgi:molybdopterin-guanine dinucleotide biosynthesis protein A